MKTALRRQVKYQHLNAFSDLSKTSSLECFFSFAPLVESLLEESLTVEQVFEQMKSIKTKTQSQYKNANKPGLDHFKILMEHCPWSSMFTQREIAGIW
jgi:hypothetical protein